jgi:hypothetical protein
VYFWRIIKYCLVRGNNKRASGNWVVGEMKRKLSDGQNRDSRGDHVITPPSFESLLARLTSASAHRHLNNYMLVEIYCFFLMTAGHFVRSPIHFGDTS